MLLHCAQYWLEFGTLGIAARFCAALGEAELLVSTAAAGGKMGAGGLLWICIRCDMSWITGSGVRRRASLRLCMEPKETPAVLPLLNT